jgi:hypothetical protein
MTKKQIRNAVTELRDTLHLQWGDGNTYRFDNTHLKTLARLAYHSLTLEASLQAQALVIESLRMEIRRIRHELKDCIAQGAGTSLPLGGGEDYTSDPKVAAFTGVEYVDPLGPLKST